ncbi:MAG: MmgE/PrpD family protein [Pseudomonadales bacterium]|nr:MmgE/PrpD family protein [Pseudomonadales bacterium]
MIADELWQQFGKLQYQDIPETTRTVAKQCLLDWMGCAVAGSKEPLSDILRAEFGDASGGCSIIGSDQKTSPQAAALINGAAGHALDFDDTHMGMGGHPSVPVAPAALAIAEDLNASGQQLLTAYIVGLEVECRLGLLIGGQHYAKGWHVTSTIGVFGAVAAVSHLLGLSELQFANAFGLAASQASGLKANFGTMTKPFHAGHAAERGLVSARLALKGFTANAGAFEGNQGLLEAASGGVLDWDAYTPIKEQWLTENTLFKYNAACYLTHASIEALKEMGDYASVTGCQSIDLFVNPSLLNVCGIENPETGLEAKFSLRANAAMTIVGLDTTDPATYTEENLFNPEVQNILQKVQVNTDESVAGTQSKVVFHNTDGSSQERFYDTGIPATNLAAQQIKLEAKFGNLVRPILGEGAERLKQYLLALESTDTMHSMW